jgi:hypothetical protein
LSSDVSFAEIVSLKILIKKDKMPLIGKSIKIVLSFVFRALSVRFNKINPPFNTRADIFLSFF